MNNDYNQNDLNSNTNKDQNPISSFDNSNTTNSINNQLGVQNNINTNQTPVPSFDMNSSVNNPINNSNGFNQVNSNPNVNNNTTNKSNLKIKWILIALLAVIVICVIVFLLTKFVFKKDSTIDSVTNSDAFFIKNSDGVYAVFNKDGKQITDFEYKNVNKFLNGSSLVTNLNDKKGVISSSGKMIVNYDECEYLYEAGALYLCSNIGKDDKLIDAKGKTIRSEKSLTSSSNSTDLISIIGSDNGYLIYNYDGKLVYTFEESKDILGLNAPVVTHEVDNYVIIFYKDNNYLFDVKECKLLLSIKSDKYFTIAKYNKITNEFIISNLYDFDGKMLKFVKNNKIMFENTDKRSNLYFFNELLILDEYDTYNKYILDENGNKLLQISGNGKVTAYKDSENYIVSNKDGKRNTDFYVDGKKVKSINCDSNTSGYSPLGIYSISGCDSKDNYSKYAYYNSNGEKITDYYSSTETFDQNGVAKIHENSVYFLINKSGKKISGDYKYIDKYTTNNSNNEYSNIDFYYGRKENDEIDVLSSDGSVLISVNKILNNDGNIGVITYEKNNKYGIYNYKDKKIIISDLDVRPYAYEEYFYTEKDSKRQYYSYKTSKMFYES